MHSNKTNGEELLKNLWGKKDMFSKWKWLFVWKILEGSNYYPSLLPSAPLPSAPSVPPPQILQYSKTSISRPFGPSKKLSSVLGECGLNFLVYNHTAKPCWSFKFSVTRTLRLLYSILSEKKGIKYSESQLKMQSEICYRWALAKFRNQKIGEKTLVGSFSPKIALCSVSDIQNEGKTVRMKPKTYNECLFSNPRLGKLEMNLQMLNFVSKIQNDIIKLNKQDNYTRNIWDGIIHSNWPKKVGKNEFFKSQTEKIEFKWTLIACFETGAGTNL